MISALVFGGKTQSVLEMLLMSNHEVWVSKYVMNEFKSKLDEKWSDNSDKLMGVLEKLPIHFCDSTNHMVGELRDKKDIPVLSDALYHKADIILTGDKDFLEANLEIPLVFSPAMLEEYLNSSR